MVLFCPTPPIPEIHFTFWDKYIIKFATMLSAMEHLFSSNCDRLDIRLRVRVPPISVFIIGPIYVDVQTVLYLQDCIFELKCFKCFKSAEQQPCPWMKSKAPLPSEELRHRTNLGLYSNQQIIWRNMIFVHTNIRTNLRLHWYQKVLQTNIQWYSYPPPHALIWDL